MKHAILILIIILICTMKSYSQDQLPYREVPDYPETYTAGSVAARMIDGLGFRFYWATDSLRDVDLSFKPSEEGRTLLETMEHIYSMSWMIRNSTTSSVNSRDGDELDYYSLRKQTLINFQIASQNLLNSNDLESMKIVFEGKNGQVEYPFWNNLNGPIADCLWHVGQIVSFRRTNGNPIASKLSFFSGKLRE